MQSNSSQEGTMANGPWGEVVASAVKVNFRSDILVAEARIDAATEAVLAGKISGFLTSTGWKALGQGTFSRACGSLEEAFTFRGTIDRFVQQASAGAG